MRGTNVEQDCLGVQTHHTLCKPKARAGTLKTDLRLSDPISVPLPSVPSLNINIDLFSHHFLFFNPYVRDKWPSLICWILTHKVGWVRKESNWEELGKSKYDKRI